MIDPRIFPCMDDDPRNSGYGYNTPNPYDNYDSERDEEQIEEPIPDENCDDE